jgi:prepilin-type N-terminal cleavage/methylation domain-containing protein
MKTNLPCARSGFTLIELLTVIAIVGILAAILLPVTAKIREGAYASKSIGNLRQLGLAANLYATDSQGFFPSEVRVDSSGNPDYSKPWSTDPAFTRYFSMIDPQWTPGQASIAQSGFPVAPHGTVGMLTIGYNVSDLYRGLSQIDYRKRALRQSDPKTAGRLIMFAEATDYKIAYEQRGDWAPANDSGSGPAFNAIALRANGNTLAVHYAGNVSKITKAELEDVGRWRAFP